MKRIVTILTLIVLAIGLSYGQAPLNPPQGYTFSASAPPGVRTVNYSITGTPGNNTLYYWVVARYASGQVRPYAPLVVYNAPVLAGPPSIVLTWVSPSTNVVSYDVLKTTTPTFPTSCAGCKIMTATAVLTFTDTGAAGAANTFVASPNVRANITLNNSGASPVLISSVGQEIQGNQTVSGTGTYGALNTSGAGTVASWKKYTVTMVAGPNWHVTGITPDVAAAGALTQDITLFTLPANGFVEQARAKTGVACTGATTSVISDFGVTGTAGYFSTGGTYDIQAAPAATNLLNAPLTGVGSNTAAATNVTMRITNTVDNITAIVVGCSVDVWIKWGVTQ